MRRNLTKNKVYDVNKIIFKTSDNILEIHNEDKNLELDCRVIIKTDLQEVGWSMDWIGLVKFRDRWQTLLKGIGGKPF